MQRKLVLSSSNVERVPEDDVSWGGVVPHSATVQSLGAKQARRRERERERDVESLLSVNAM